MIVRTVWWIALLGLGAVAGAVFPDGANAQVPVRRDTVSGRRDTVPSRVDTAGGRRNLPPAGRDTIRVPTPLRADSMIRNDSIIKGIVPLPVTVKADTIKSSLARAETPPILEIGPQRIYDRAAIYATGALTLGDLLARVPGLTEFTTGFLAAPAVYASLGDVRRIRLYLDGLELDPLDLRARGVAPVNDLPLHALEELRIERGSDEVRVYARSWRVDRTIPFTRADIATGDLNTNLYRAYFGRRYDHGEALQVAAEQYTTQPDRRLPSSDAVNVMARLGITRGPWSADGFVQRTHRNRAQWVGTGDLDETRDTVPGLATYRTTAYARLGNGDPDRGRWLQLMFSASDYRLSARSSTSLLSTLPSARDSANAPVDSVSYVSQYLLTGGITRGRLSISAAERIRVGDGRTSHIMSGRAAAARGPLAISAFAEGRSYLNPGRLEGTVTFVPFDRVALLGSASRTGAGDFDRLLTEPHNGVFLDETGVFQPGAAVTLKPSDTLEVTRYRIAARSNVRAEAGVRVRDLWISAGLLRRGPTTLLAPAEFDTVYARARATRAEGEATGTTLSLRGRLWRAVHADAWGVAWKDSTGLYRPRYQTRSELYIQTNLLDKFPRGNFGLLTSLAHEYRSGTRFPVGTDSVRTAPGYRVLAFKLEIRVQTAVVSYQFRNLLQEKYQQVPGYNLPRQTQFYGVRWEFWN